MATGPSLIYPRPRELRIASLLMVLPLALPTMTTMAGPIFTLPQVGFILRASVGNARRRKRKKARRFCTVTSETAALRTSLKGAELGCCFHVVAGGPPLVISSVPAKLM